MLEEIHLELINLNEINKIDYKKNLFKDDQINMELTLENFRNDFIKKNNSIIAKTFFFMLQSTTMCKKCGITKYNFQVLFILEFQLKEIYNHNSRLNKPLINSRGKKFVDIFSCFDYNSQPSDFTGENQLFCTKCNSLTDSISSNNIFSLSPVLIIILDRGKDKNFECDVDFPEYLNLQNYVAYQKSIYNYQLRGVITHLGESGMSGHFIAFCRHRVNNKWYLYNDSKVILCENQNKDFLNGNAYILFYESIENKNNTIFEESLEMNYIKKNMNMNANNIDNFNNNCNVMINENNNMMMNNINNFQNNFAMNYGINNMNIIGGINNNEMNNINMNNFNGQNMNNNFININNFNNNMNNMI